MACPVQPTTETVETFPAKLTVVQFSAGSRLLNDSGSPVRNGIYPIKLRQYYPTLKTVVGHTPVYSLLLSSADNDRWPYFVGGCIYMPENDQLLITSDALPLLDQATGFKSHDVVLSTVQLKRSSVPSQSPEHSTHHVVEVFWSRFNATGVSMPAGVMRYERGVLFCAQGTATSGAISGGLWKVPDGTKTPKPVVTSFFNVPFNSIYAVAQDKQGALWFTDPTIGFEKGFGRRPQLPRQVYYYRPQIEDLRVVADGFGRPTGIAISPDNLTLYVADSEAGDGKDGDKTRPATIYAFDVMSYRRVPFLTNRRIFSMAAVGVPLAVHCDLDGNVYAACGDGIEIWSQRGTALGLIHVEGGCSNFCFGKPGEIFICARTTLWRFHSNIASLGQVQGQKTA